MAPVLTRELSGRSRRAAAGSGDRALRDHLVGQPVAEVFLLRIAAPVLEREDGQHCFFPGFRGRSRVILRPRSFIAGQTGTV